MDEQAFEEDFAPVLKYLKQWKLDRFAANFRKEEVTIQVFFDLDGSALKDLIPTQGPRCLFIKNVAEEKLKMDKRQVRVENFAEGVVAVETGQQEVGVVEQPLGPTEVAAPLGAIAVASPTREPQRQDLPPCDKYLRNIEFLNLKELLNSTSDGRGVMFAYENAGALDNQLRNQLCSCITTFFLSGLGVDGYDSRTSNKHLKVIARKIQELFPKEQEETYYIDPVTEQNKRTVSIGKLVWRFRNRTKSLINTNVIPNKRPRLQGKDKGTLQTLEPEDERNQEDIRITLETKREPWIDVLRDWNKSFGLRRCSAVNYDNDLHKLITQWPLLSHKLGYSLIDRDFEEIYPGKEKSLCGTTWLQVREKLSTFLLKEVKDRSIQKLLVELHDKNSDLSTNEDTRNFVVLRSLPGVCKPTVYVKAIIDKVAVTWKPSIAECQQGIILFVQAGQNIKRFTEERRNKFLRFNLMTQPFVVVSGTDIRHLTNFYVYVSESTTYELPSLIMAVDTCFKCFTTLNLQYPIDCDGIWSFLQAAVYGIKTKHDKFSECVNRLCRAMK